MQTWPIEGQIRREAPLVTGDSLQGMEYGGVTENYWLVSTGVALYVDEDVPAFISELNSQVNLQSLFRIEFNYS